MALDRIGDFMKSLLNWAAAAASLIGLFFTLRPAAASLTPWQILFVLLVILVFGTAAILDMREERKKTAKTYPTEKSINDYMFSMLQKSGRCEICSRDASWVSDRRIYALLQDKAERKELTFLVQKCTKELAALRELGAEVIEYGILGFDPMARFTIVNSGNSASSYVAVGRKKPNEPHIIEEMDSSHPTHTMARDLIRSVRAANDNYKKK